MLVESAFVVMIAHVFFFSSRRRHTRYWRDWSSDVCSSDLSYLLSYVGERVVADLRIQVYEHLQSLSLRFFTDRRVGEITSRVTSDVTIIQHTTTGSVAQFLQNSISFLGGLSLMIFLSYKLTLVTMLVVPLMLAAAVVFGKRIRNISTEVQDRLANATAVLEETVSGIRVVQSFARESYEVGRFRAAIEEAF